MRFKVEGAFLAFPWVLFGPFFQQHSVQQNHPTGDFDGNFGLLR